jgi:hypothetical protein
VNAAARRPWANTLRDLAFRPGTITRAHLDGRGGAYLPLGRLLVLFAAAFFGLTMAQQSGGGSSPETTASCAQRASADLGALMGPDAGAGAAGGASVAGLRHLAGEVLCNPQRFTRAVSLAGPIAFLLLLPLSAGLMQLAFRKEMPRFADNWTYGLEAHAALFLLLLALFVLSLPGVPLVGLLASVAGLFYATWNVLAGVERAYRVSARVAAWRTTAVGVVYAAALTVVATLVFTALFGRS